ncbi:hypothetical protein AVEN_127116-1 [Araneus ventricosus]|uniref:Uncharacterized protein n=1 Tax=Araneus ventricosus TaxID=182803 RepID=A0A4Y2GS15_ARAVE|nr:hypothetical protein AVEN_127116-1 [Araneus ventricosus]
MVVVAAAMIFINPKFLYKENIPEVQVSFWLRENHWIVRKLLSLIDDGIDLYMLFGIPTIVIMIYTAYCLELASVHSCVANILMKQRENREVLFFIAKKSFHLFAHFEELMSLPIGIVVVRITLEIFRIMIGWFHLQYNKNNLSNMLVLIFVMMVAAADFAQGSISSLRKRLVIVISNDTHLLSHADFYRKYLLLKESESETQLTAWKVFILNRSFILNIITFCSSYAIIMLQFNTSVKTCSPTESGSIMK